MVSPLLNKKELSEVKKILDSIRFSKLHRKELLIPKKKVDVTKLPEILDEVSLAAKYGSGILKKFQTVEIDPESNQSILKVLGSYLVKKGYTNNSDLLVNYAEQA